MMSDRPEAPPHWITDIPSWAWEQATQFAPDPDHDASFTEIVEAIARAILKAREEAFEELEAALTAKKYLPSQGIDAEMEAFNDGLDEAIDAIRQHSQKGER